MEISIGTLRRNAEAVRKRLPESVRMLCVVKANAYGHDAIYLTKALNDLADGYAVAIVEEARELRANGIGGMILILGGAAESSLREAVRLDASQAVYTTEMLAVLEDEAALRGKRAKAHLKLDTGMSRIGVRSDEALAEMLAMWKKCPHVDMEGCFTHFCVADSDPEFTRAQNDRFNEMLATVRAAGFHPIAHAAASSAMLLPECQHDMVRAGVVLYGSDAAGIGGLEYAQRLVSGPVRIETIHAGDTVGYGRTFRAERETTVMTVAIGYGDGYPRLLSNRADVLVRGKRAHIIGNVCMDMLMVDVTDIPGASLDDEVVLMGRQGDAQITPAELAKLAQTIDYEIMLGFSARVKHVITD